jgi:hypothetical protein
VKKLILFVCINLISNSIGFSQVVPSYVPTSGLVGWWPFNGNANDESGNGNNGTVNGATLTTDRFGVANKAYGFDGVNDYIIINNSFDFQSRSYSFWFNPTTINTITGTLIVSDNPQLQNGVTQARVIELNGIDSVQIATGLLAGFYKGSISSTNNWQMLTFIRTSNSVSFYLNGNFITSTNQIGNYTSSSGSLKTILGTDRNFLFDFYNGKIDDIAIYNRALTQQEITNLYTNSAPPSITTAASPTMINCGESSTLTASSTSAAQPCVKADLPTTLQNGLVGYWPFCGNANDASGNGNNGTVNGATLTTDRFANGSSAYTFDGVNDFIFIPPNASFNASSLSVSFWINIPSIIPIGVQFLVSGNSSNAAWSIQYNVQEYGLSKNQGCGTSVVYSMGLAPIVNNWEQITFVFNSSSTLIYKNGALISSQSGSALSGTCGNTGLNIGFDVFGAPEYFLGKLDDICIHNRALSATEIQQLYNLGNVSYSWSTGATTPSITVTPAQITSYTCTATNSAGSTTSSVSVTVADTLTWTGTFDTDWHKPCNWSPQFVPKCCNNVSVPLTTNQPIVAGVAAAEDLSIFTTNGAQVTVNNGANLQIADCPTTITTTACPSLALISTAAVSSITQTTAVSGGTIAYQGASAITARGICWSTSPNPTIANSITSNGTGIGTFTSNLSGLVAGTTYYVRAYATNGSGTSYGNQVSFATQTLASQYLVGSVFCASGPTAIVDVTNPTTGKTWMDRNLGATQVATSAAHVMAYGDLYQWGRRSDGHQCRNSTTISGLSNTDQPNHGFFILSPNVPADWRATQNDNLWQGLIGVNNPCPSGYRLPTLVEIDNERVTWASQNSAGAFGSLLKLTVAGIRMDNNGSLNSVGVNGYYWSSTVLSYNSRHLQLQSNFAGFGSGSRALGMSIRCIKN